MEVLKKNNIEFFFVFLITFGYIFFYAFAVPFDLPNYYFAVPVRIPIFLIGVWVIYANFKNIKKRKSTILFASLFWLFYLFKTIYSFNHFTFSDQTKSLENQIYIRIICLNFIPVVALLSIDFSKEMIRKLTRLIFDFLLIMLAVSLLYVVFVSHLFTRSSGIFVSYYISTAHYGLSLIVLSIFYYFLSPQKKLKPFLGLGLGLFTIFISSARSPILAAAVLIVLIFLYINKLKYWLGLLAFIIMFVIGIYYIRHSSLSTEYIVRIYDAIFEGNAYGRSYYLSKGWGIFKNNPLTGGATLFEDGMYPHNIFVEVLMSMGIVGGVFFFLYFKDLLKFRMKLIRENTYYIPYFLFFVQYLVLVQTSYCIFANIEFWCFSAVIISIILFCNDEKIKSDDGRRHAAGNY